MWHWPVGELCQRMLQKNRLEWVSQVSVLDKLEPLSGLYDLVFFAPPLLYAAKVTVLSCKVMALGCVLEGDNVHELGRAWHLPWLADRLLDSCLIVSCGKQLFDIYSVRI